nr:TadE/TadG family type IV pilus assembly protein [uncultured Rhodopila sp.]
MSSLLRDRRGVTSVFVAFIIVALIGAIGVAVDGTRLVMVKSRLKTSVDAAALIAARDMTIAGSATNAKNLFWANFGRSSATSTLGFLSTNITSVAVTNVNTNTVSVQAQGLMPTTFMNILGISSVSVVSSAQATRAASGVEIALVLDNTGSMAGWPIASVIASASDLVNVLYANGTVDTEPNLWVSVVPFSAEVNIGPNNTAWLKAGSNTVGAYMNTTWMGCVMARYDTVDAATGLTNDFTDVPPASAPMTPYLYPSTYGKYTVLDKGKTAYFGDNDWTPANITEAQQSKIAQNTAVGPNLGCPQNSTGGGLPILPETASRATVLAEVNQMVANFRGGTFINLGLQAGWWTLSPRWRGAAGWGNATLPLDYNKPYMKKVIVLMTDGNNQWYDYPGGAPGAGPSNLPDGTATHWNNDGNTDFTGYGRLLDNNMKLPAGQNTQANATTNINNKMSQLCTLIKAQGIIIYCILFNHDGSVTSDTETLFQNCATSSQYYFVDATDAQLQATFSNIGGQLASLRISQ